MVSAFEAGWIDGQNITGDFAHAEAGVFRNGRGDGIAPECVGRAGRPLLGAGAGDRRPCDVAANQSLPPVNGDTNSYARSGTTAATRYDLVPGEQCTVRGVPEQAA